MVQQLQAELQDKAQQIQAVQWEKRRELQAQEQRIQCLSQHLARKEQLLQVRCRRPQLSTISQGPCSSLLWYFEMQNQSVAFLHASKKTKEILLHFQGEEGGMGVQRSQLT